LIQRPDDVGHQSGSAEYCDEDCKGGDDGQPVEYHQWGQEEDVGEDKKSRQGGEGGQDEQVPVTAG